MGKTATKPVVRLEDWSVVTFLGQYEAPELRVTCLHGLAYGHPGFPEGTEITTSRLLDSQERVAETYNTRYLLGEMSLKYRTYLENKGITYDSNHPITVK